jgi:phosphoribosylformylglycinamidine synthase subunit PurL
MGATSELCAAGGFGARIDVDAVPQAVPGLAPFVVACAETQERMLWAVPPHFTPALLALYNERFTLPDVAAGACAKVIGRVTADKRYRILASGRAVCDVPIDVLTGAFRAQRSLSEASSPSHAVPAAPPLDLQGKDARTEELLLKVLAHHDVCSRRPLIEHYDLAVRGATVIPSGYADAGVVAVRRGARLGIALSVDGNARFAAISARLAAAHAVMEAARNVAAVGAQPIGLTDCLNYGNPEDPAAYRQLSDGIDGLAEAANALQLNEPGEPLPFVSGNVSLYNQSAAGGAIVPSAIVACVGRVDDIGRVVTMRITAGDRRLLLLGPRTAALGGSVLADVLRSRRSDLPALDFAEATTSIRVVIEGIKSGCITAAHDISDGGLLACVAEMCLGGDADGTIGARLTSPSYWAAGQPVAAALFGETPGFVVEVPADRLAAFEAICLAAGATPLAIGATGGASLHVDGLCDVPLELLARAWITPLQEVFA